ncbi:efflux RND transporter periplasmic adaptor subunit [Nitrospira sp. Nam80]
MAGDLFSASWYRVKAVIPRLRSHVRLQRHEYRGHVWYVFQDLMTDRFHRFTPAAYGVIGLIDGRRTIQQIWDEASERLGDEAPTQDEVIGLISQLYAADVLLFDIAPDLSEFNRRRLQRFRRKVLERAAQVFSWRIPLCDPDRLLTRFLPVARLFVGWPAGLVWFLVVGAGVLLGGMHWPELSEDFTTHALAPQNAILLWLLFPVLKSCHELAHGFVTKVFGGEVHELGLMLLILTPVPYVDASAAWAFTNKWHRILVGAAGMMAELFLASLALVVWVSAEPGLVRMMAYNTILIAGVSTVLFNANPLLRFDGYYMLMDFLEIPNLKTRAARYFAYVVERYVLGQREAELPHATIGERIWFMLYGGASSVFRIIVVVGILLFLGEEFPMLAIFFAGFTAVTMIGVPLAKGLSFLFTNSRLRRVRIRAVTTAVGFTAAMAGAICFLPIPLYTLTEGVVWLPDEAFVRAETSGFVERVVAQPGARVQPGDLLVVCRNPELSSQLSVLEGRLEELNARRTEQEPTDRVKAAILEEEIAYTLKERNRVRERVEHLQIRSKQVGTFVVPQAQDLPGRYLQQGEALAHVLDLRTIIVRALIAQDEIDLVRHRLDSVEVRLAEQVMTTVSASLSRIVPSATSQLPSAALGSTGGGQAPMDQSDPKGMTAMQRFFQVDLTLNGAAHTIDAGGRAYVRFNHGWESPLDQWSRRLRQLFLSRFNV